MKELLSNEEIDTLLDMFRADGAAGAPGEPGAEPTAEPAEESTSEARVSPIDILKPNRFTRDHLDALERILGGVADKVAAVLGDRLRLEVTCECIGVEQLRFATWLEHSRSPTAIYQLGLRPFEQPGLLTVSGELFYGIVDRVLGGSGRFDNLPADFTDAEFTVADAVVTPVIDEFCRGLSEIESLEWTVDRRASKPVIAPIVSPEEVVLSAYLQIGGDTLHGDVRFVIPFSQLEPRLDRISRRRAPEYREAPGDRRTDLEGLVRDVGVAVTVSLGETSVGLQSLLALDVGDVIPLETRVGEPLTAAVEGAPKIRGHLGRSGSRLAYRVAEVLDSQ